jgi:hypothetical protein
MSEYPDLRMTPYFNVPIDEVPLDHLIWLFLKFDRHTKDLNRFHSILSFFFTKLISVADKTEDNGGYCFYFDEYPRYEPGSGNEIPFMKSEWEGIDSNGNEVYEIIHADERFYIQEKDRKWFINRNIVNLNYYFGVSPGIYEKNTDYYFEDSYGRLYSGAYLLRVPWIPNETKKFSENILNKV